MVVNVWKKIELYMKENKRESSRTGKYGRDFSIRKRFFDMEEILKKNGTNHNEGECKNKEE